VNEKLIWPQSLAAIERGEKSPTLLGRKRGIVIGEAK